MGKHQIVNQEEKPRGIQISPPLKPLIFLQAPLRLEGGFASENFKTKPVFGIPRLMPQVIRVGGTAVLPFLLEVFVGDFGGIWVKEGISYGYKP